MIEWRTPSEYAGLGLPDLPTTPRGVNKLAKERGWALGDELVEFGTGKNMIENSRFVDEPDERVQIGKTAAEIRLADAEGCLGKSAVVIVPMLVEGVDVVDTGVLAAGHAWHGIDEDIQQVGVRVVGYDDLMPVAIVHRLARARIADPAGVPLHRTTPYEQSLGALVPCRASRVAGKNRA